MVRHGKVESGVLHGDLILVGQGDLAFGGRTGPDGAASLSTTITPMPAAIRGAAWWRLTRWRDSTTWRGRGVGDHPD